MTFLHVEMHVVFSEIFIMYSTWVTQESLPEAFFTRLPLSIISLHLLQISRAWQSSIKFRSLRILSTISGGKLLKLTDSLILFASDILNVCFRRNLQSFGNVLCDITVVFIKLNYAPIFFLKTSLEKQEQQVTSATW